MQPLRIGLLVNPVAGLGGPCAQKGSDAANIRFIAAQAGVQESSPSRARRCLQQLLALLGNAERECLLVTGQGELGASLARGLTCSTLVVGTGPEVPGRTTSEDTKTGAAAIRDVGVDLLLFAGGDGTARDVLDAIGASVPVVGIPAGVKIYSAVFAVSPAAAGSMAAAWLLDQDRRTAEREVVDIDEDDLRSGVAVPGLYGTLCVPVDPTRMQERKRASPATDSNAVRALAVDYVRQMDPSRLYVLGPGGTTHAIGTECGLNLTRLGVDVVKGGHLICRDVDARGLESVVGTGTATIVLTPLGGQGFLIGRGNQQISPPILKRCQLEIVATSGKLASLAGRPLRVDSGNDALDATFNGYARVFTGPGAETIYPIQSSREES